MNICFRQKQKNKKGKKIDSNTSIRLYTCSVHFQFFCPVSPVSIGFTGSGSTDPVLKGRSALGGPHHFDLKRAGFPSSSKAAHYETVYISQPLGTHLQPGCEKRGQSHPGLHHQDGVIGEVLL